MKIPLMSLLQIFAIILAIFESSCAMCAEQTSGSKLLIEFGWDEPDTSFLRRHVREMEKMPFDGVVFNADYHTTSGESSSFSTNAWGMRKFSPGDLLSARSDMQATTFTRFRHNFLRLNVTPGNVAWFDDANYATILANAKLAAEFARETGSAGILFDVEAYAQPIFDYRRQPTTSTISWDEYSLQVRKRGRQVMEAFQQGYPDLEVFLTFAYSLPWEQSFGLKQPLSETESGLLAPFLDGMLEGARGHSRIIDGYEVSYGFRHKIDFDFGLHHMKSDVLRIVGNRQLYEKYCEAGFGLWLDFDQHHKTYFANDPEKNYFTPDGFYEAVSTALSLSDQYVWIYTELPRWWGSDGRPTNLSPAYIDAVESATLAVRKGKL
jgi:hypothetical protein